MTGLRGDRVNSVAEQAPLFLSHDAIALAARILETTTIADLDESPCFVDQTGFVQRSKDDRYGWAMDAEHRRHQVVCQWNVAVVDEVADRQQPANAPLLHRMEHVAHGHLHAADEQHLCETPEGGVHRFIRKQFISQHFGAYPLGDTRNLNDAIARHHRDAWENGGSREAVTADEAHFERLAGFECGDEGHDGGNREVRHPERLMRPKQDLLSMEIHRLEMRPEPFEGVRGEQCEKAIVRPAVRPIPKIAHVDRQLRPILPADPRTGHRFPRFLNQIFTTEDANPFDVIENRNSNAGELSFDASSLNSLSGNGMVRSSICRLTRKIRSRARYFVACGFF